MFIGHLGVGLALKKWLPSLNLCWLFTCVLLVDLLLWLFILLGIEKVHIPENYQELHYLTFTFPYSHGLASSLGWSMCTYLLGILLTKSQRSALVLAIGVFSHVLLDYVVHSAEIPLITDSATIRGLGLWNHLYVALTLELLLLLGGLYMYLKVTIARSTLGNYCMILYMSLLTVGLFTGQILSPQPVSAYQIASGSIGALGAILVLVYFIDKTRRPKHKEYKGNKALLIEMEYEPKSSKRHA